MKRWGTMAVAIATMSSPCVVAVPIGLLFEVIPKLAPNTRK